MNDILNNDLLVTELASKSESHRLGFDKIILEVCPAYQLHLHIWWPRSTPFKDGIHNHKFNFTSHILKGHLEEEIYVRSDKDGILMHEYLALSNAVKSSDRFQYKGRNQIKCISKTTRPEGTTYFLHNQSFHNAVPTFHDELTITLFVRSANVKDADTIFEEHPFTEVDSKVSVPNVILTEEQYRERLISVIKLINK